MRKMKQFKAQVQMGLERLQCSGYSGNGVAVGLDREGEHIVQMYWIREESRCLILIEEDRCVFSKVVQPELGKDPLVIDHKILGAAVHNGHSANFLGNGPHTNAFLTDFTKGRSFSQTMTEWTYHDDLDCTPRITAASYWELGRPVGHLSLLSKSLWSSACDRHNYVLEDMGPGYGAYITTYLDPELRYIEFEGDADTIADQYVKVLGNGKRVSLAVKLIPRGGKSTVVIRNDFEKRK